MVAEQVSLGDSLLARKGGAAPAGMVGGWRAAASSAESEQPAEASAPAAEEASGAAASLLPFELTRQTYRSAEAAAADLPGPHGKSVVLHAPPPADWRAGTSTRPKRDRSGAWLALFLAMSLAAVSAIGWYAMSRPPSGAAAKSAPSADAPAEPAPAQTAASEAAPSVAPRLDPPARSAESVTDDIPVAALAEPSVDLARVEPNGEAVIAGRAAPNSELIILDNGKPIGTVSADAFGEWVFVPETPLPEGGHEFGLVVKSVQGKVSLPAPHLDAPEKGGLDDGQASGAGAPAPSKPASAESHSLLVPSGTSGEPDFVVQLASVKTRAGAEQEWLKLKRRFPEILQGMEPTLDEVKLEGRGTVVRLRTGAFAEHGQAAGLCARFAAQRQDCLVVQRRG